MQLCHACGHDNPDDAMYCNLCGKAIERSTLESQSEAPPDGKKTFVFPGPFSTTVLTKVQLNVRIAFEVCFAAVLIVIGFIVGQPFYGILLGMIALGAGYIIYLLSTEAS